MKRVYIALGTVLLCSGALMAQSTMDKGQMAKDKPMKDGVVTVTGCVAQADDMKQFTLTNATMSPMAKMGADAAMKPDAPKPDMAMSYALDGGDLKPHLGHKVEVSGTMEKKPMKPMMDHDKMAGPETMGDKDKMGTTAKKDTMAGKIKVTSVKMLAANCM